MVDDFFLDLLKAMYGLNDAPLCWQLFLADFYVATLGAMQSTYDECFFIWHDTASQDVEALASAHVDDNGIMSTDDNERNIGCRRPTWSSVEDEDDIFGGE